MSYYDAYDAYTYYYTYYRSASYAYRGPYGCGDCNKHYLFSHEFGNTGSAPARFLEFFVPGGSEGYHLERAALEHAKSSAEAGQYSNLDAETLSALARKYGIEFVN